MARAGARSTCCPSRLTHGECWWGGQVALQRREAEQRAGSEQEAIQALQRQQEERMAVQQATIAQLWELRAALSRAQVRCLLSPFSPALRDIVVKTLARF